jgi:Domain of unknown function (DUF4190)
MSTPPPPPPGEPYDPNQPGQQPGQPPPYGEQQPSYGQQPPEGFASYPPPYAPPVQGGYGQGPENHPNATTALVLGIVGVICCSLTAPFAWVMGKKAMDEIDASGGRIGGRGNAQAGYVLGILGTILMVLAIVVTVIAVAVGGFAFTFNAGT